MKFLIYYLLINPAFSYPAYNAALSDAAQSSGGSELSGGMTIVLIFLAIVCWNALLNNNYLFFVTFPKFHTAIST